MNINIKNIIQTWKTKDIPEHYQKLVDNVKSNNTHWNYMFFDDNDIENFVKTKMPKYYNVYTHLPQKIQKIDFFRYLAIYYYGGVYLDLDIQLTKPLDDLYYDSPNICKFPIEIQNATDHLLVSQNFPKLIGNYAFYSPPKHPFILKIIENIECQRISTENIRIAQEENSDAPSQVHVYCTTGPVLVTQTYIDNSDMSIILLNPTTTGNNCFGDYGKHLCYGSWK